MNRLFDVNIFLIKRSNFYTHDVVCCSDVQLILLGNSHHIVHIIVLSAITRSTAGNSHTYIHSTSFCSPFIHNLLRSRRSKNFTGGCLPSLRRNGLNTVGCSINRIPWMGSSRVKLSNRLVYLVVVFALILHGLFISLVFCFAPTAFFRVSSGFRYSHLLCTQARLIKEINATWPRAMILRSWMQLFPMKNRNCLDSFVLSLLFVFCHTRPVMYFSYKMDLRSVIYAPIWCLSNDDWTVHAQHD